MTHIGALPELGAERTLYVVPDSIVRTELITPEPWRNELDEYFAWLHASGTSRNTIKLHSYHLRRFAITTGLGPFDAKLQNLVDYVSETDWAPGTKRSVRTTLRSFYLWAKSTKRIKKDPAKKLPKVRVAPGVPRPASETDVSAGLNIADQRVRLMIRLAAEAGLRCCEVAVVHTDDLVRDLIGWSLVVHGKGGKTRVVPLNTGLANDLMRAYPGWLFGGQIDGHLSAAYVSKLISRALPPKVTGHPLRHRFASIAYEGTGNDIRAVQELLGHASVATTQIYTRVPDGAKRRGVLAAAGLPHAA